MGNTEPMTYEGKPIRTHLTKRTQFIPGTGAYKQWTSDHHLIRIKPENYQHWKRFILTKNIREYWNSVYGTDEYIWIHIKWQRRITLWNDYGEIFLCPWLTGQENIRFIKSKGRRYEHQNGNEPIQQYFQPKPIIIPKVEEPPSTEEQPPITEEKPVEKPIVERTEHKPDIQIINVEDKEMNREDKETSSLDEETVAEILRTFDAQEIFTDEKPRPVLKERTAREILELTPEQALSELTLEQYDLYCKYKK